MGFYNTTPGRLCAHCGAELSRYRQTYCTNRCREAVPRSYACNPKGRGARRTPSQITPEFRARLVGLWEDGITIAAMGARLGITKNSVAGFVYRWKLVPRGTPIIRKSRCLTPPEHHARLAPGALDADRSRGDKPPRPASFSSHGTGPFGPAAISSPPQVTPPPAQPTPVPRAVLSPPKTCQYALNDDKPFVFCGKPTVDNGPYCQTCRARCWVLPPRFRMLEAAA